MDTRTFLSRIVPDDGVYFIAQAYSKPDGTEGIKHIKVAGLDETVVAINRLNKQNQNIFIATGSFATPTRRVKSNLKGKKCLYLDLDCGPKKDFPDKKQAIIDLHAFIKDTGLPKYSFLVDSGNGIHAYWTLETAIDHEQWVALANSLKAKCKAHGFPADPAVTTDGVRILRIPGSINYKDPTNTKQCRVLNIDHGDIPVVRLNKVLLGASTPALSVVPGNPVPTGTVDNSDLGGGVREFTNPPAALVFEKCETFKHALATGGKNDSQPLWAQLLHVLAYLPDGRDYIHKISDQHPQYTHDETERKFAEKLQVRVDGGTAGPTSCEQFATTGGTQCHKCPYYGNVKNPCLAVNYRLPGELPQGYSMKDTGMYKEVQVDGEEEGYTELKRISPYRFFDASINCPPGQETHFFRFYYNIGQTTKRVAELTIAELIDTKQFNAAMAYTNISMQPEEMKGVQRLMTTWKQQMEAAKFITSAPNTMGWTDDGKRVGFALAKKILWEDGKETINPLPNAELLVHYSPTGKLKPWKKAAKLITDNPNLELQVALASSFAAPLMVMTNTHGAVLSIVSQASGIGKTKALHTAQAVWGKPNQINSMDDTGNSLIRKMGILNNLPAYWDEIHLSGDNNNVDAFTNMVFRLAQGKEKTRLTNQIKFQTSGEWTTLITVVSNDSVHDHLHLVRRGTDASIMRVLELEVTNPKQSKDDLTKALTVFGNMDKNYGVAGEEYAKYITEHHEELRKEIVTVIAKLSKIPHMESNERMRIALIAAIRVGAKAANACGLTEFDVNAITARMVNEIKPVVTNGKAAKRGGMNDLDILSDYISAHSQSINKINVFPQRGLNQNVTVISAPQLTPVRVQVAEGVARCRIEETHFRNWVTKNFGGGTRLLRMLKQMPSVVECRGSLAYGLPSNVPTNRPRLLELPLP